MTIIGYPNGDQYTGELSGDERFGRGMLLFANGDCYVGDFYLGQPEGEAR